MDFTYLLTYLHMYERRMVQLATSEQRQRGKRLRVYQFVCGQDGRAV